MDTLYVEIAENQQVLIYKIVVNDQWPKSDPFFDIL